MDRTQFREARGGGVYAANACDRTVGPRSRSLDTGDHPSVIYASGYVPRTKAC